jgi:hypothetical protein
MVRSPQAWTEEKIEKRFADGFGQGVGADYKPWLTVGRSTPSLGTSNRSGGRTTGRVHHFLSDIERNAFLIYDWAASVVDIREQFPLDRGETRAIAEAMGVRHPIYPKSDVPVVMTTDFLLDTAVDGRATQVARAVKPSAKLGAFWRSWRSSGATGSGAGSTGASSPNATFRWSSSRT